MCFCSSLDTKQYMKVINKENYNGSIGGTSLIGKIRWFLSNYNSKRADLTAKDHRPQSI